MTIMKFYYFIDNDKVRQGPLPLEDLRSYDIRPDTLVWCKGMEKWEKAKNLEDFSEFFKISIENEATPVDSRIKCQECGQLISENASECPNCGCPVDNSTNMKQPFQPEEPRPQEPFYYEEEPSSKTWLYAVIGILAVTLIGLAAWLFIFNDNKQNEVAVESTVSAPDNGANETDTTKTDSNTEDVVSNETGVIHRSISAGLTFKTFTKKASENGIIIQSPLEEGKVTSNLRNLGFSLIDKTTESRLDYTGEEYYQVDVLTYSKTVDGRVTTVKLETEYTEIHFPNLEDVEEFRQTVRATALKEKGNDFLDSEDVYWAGTDVSFKGTIVTLKYKWE